MGISHSTARYLAPAAFIFNFLAQQYGMFSRPNMKNVHDANLSFFSPQPFFIAGFFFPQQLFQIAWMWRLWKLSSKRSGGDVTSQGEEKELQEVVDYVPYFALGNLCIGSETLLLNTYQVW